MNIKHCFLKPFIGMVLGCCALQAEWDPEFSLEDVSDQALNQLKDPAYVNLKNSVLQYLQGSWCSAEKTNLLMDLIVLTKPQNCVEIGACTGSSVLPIAAALKYLKQGRIYAVDAWSNAEATKYLEDDDPNKAWWSWVDMNNMYNCFISMVSNWDLWSYCLPVHSPSSKAVHQFQDIDFLHLDGNFSATGSLQDVQLYLPKVKSGGYILLSNLFIMIKGKQPKLKSFLALFDTCDIVAEIERDNAILFRKK